VERAAAESSSAFGRYVKVAPLGRGGGGEVWKAYDPTLSRWIALKLLHGTSDEEIARFAREAQTAAQLSHPNIAAIFEVGREGGRHYIAMQFVEGTTLRHAGLDERGAARCVRDAARAVAHAHSKGIVHRDLKPDNVMISKEHVFVMDFGLARAVEGGTKVSVTGTVLGTPAYMPPEQARAGVVDGRADVYSLGATLYELLAGRAPFEGPTIFAVLKKVEEEEPARIARADRDLETIAMKCLEKDPGRRYETAAALADELDRWLAGEPIHAHPPSIVYRVRKGLARRKAAVVVAVLLLAVAGLVAAIALPKYLRTRRTVELWREVSGVLSRAEMAMRAGDLTRGRALLAEGAERCRSYRELAAAQYFAGRLLALGGDRAGAIESMERATFLDPAFREPRVAAGVLRAERYLEWLRELKVRDDGVSLADAEERIPELKALRDRALEDLAVPLDRSDYVSESDRRYAGGILQHARGKFGEARGSFEAALAGDPLHVPSMLALARLDLDSGRWDDALARLDRLLEVHRGLAEAARLRGGIWARRQRLTGKGYEEGLRDTSRAIELDPRMADAYGTRALLHHFRGDNDPALRDLDEAVKLDPRRADFYSNRSLVQQARAERFAAEGRPMEALAASDAALHDLDSAIRFHPTWETVIVNRAIARLKRGDRAGALADFSEALRLNPSNTNALLNRSMLHYDEGDLKQALVDGDEAVRLAPGPASWSNRAIIRQRSGDRAGALSDAEATIAKEPNHASARVTRGLLVLEAGRTEEAMADFDAAVAGDPSYQPAFLHRGRLRHRLGRIEEALRDLDRAVALAPREAMTLLARGMCRVDGRDAEGARADFDAVIAAAPAEPYGYANRGALRLAAGDKAGAAEDLRKALAVAPADWPHRARAEELLRIAEAD
jgi:serine/threonine-protein kinase